MSKKILVRCPNWLGDIIMAIPAIRALKQIFPEYEIWGYARKEYVNILKRVDVINDLVAFQKKSVFYEIKTYVPIIKKLQFEKAFILPNSWISALIPFLAKVPERYGYNIRGRRLFFTEAIPLSKKIKEMHQVYYYLGILTGLFNGNFDEKPYLKVTEKEVAYFKEKNNISDVNLCCFVPGAAYGPAKCWFADRYIQLGKILIQKGFHIVLVGSKDDRERCELIEKAINTQVTNLAGKTSIDELPVVMKSCKFTISNDSGPMHVSAAVGTPVIGIFGSTNPKTTYPFGYKDYILHREIECSYCLKRQCIRKFDKMKCMELITVEDVLNKLEEKGLI
jgi:heptosyltransferase-2